MTNNLKLSLLLFIFSFVIISCNDDDDTTEPVGEEKITYDKHVKKIIDSNCLGCHGAEVANGAPNSLTNYTEVKTASAGVTSRVADGSMPAGGGSLSATQKKTIADWAKDGFLEK
ncbi:MAG: cytochrome c [Flavobacteriaceae bacterium]|nr:cytochrome c [Flavobacteriaceae bacterium]